MVSALLSIILKGRNQMSRVSITKIFTLVSFSVVTAFGVPGFAEGEKGSQGPIVLGGNSQKQEELDAAARQKAESICTPSYVKDQYGNVKDKCLRCVAFPTLKGCDEQKDDSGCNDAFNTYKESLADAQSACDSVVGTTSRSTDRRKKCSDSIRECAQLAQQTSNQTPQEENGMSSTLNLFRQVMGGDSDAGSNGGSCLIDIDSKEAREAEKDFRDRREKLEKDKKEIEDQAVKDQEENDKEITRITKEIEELQGKDTETAAEIDAEKREKGYETQKEMMASSKRLLDLSKQMRQANDDLRRETFSHSQRMLELTAEKQNLRCKSALDQAKSCMIKSVKGIADPACKDFPISIRSKGAKAKAELKKQLQVVNNACYEQENSKKKQIEFEQSERLNQISNKMTDLQAEAKQQAEAQQAQSTNSQKIAEEADLKKENAKAILAKKIATLQAEMAQAARKLGTQNKLAQDRLKKYTEDVQTLELEQKTGKRSKTAIASTAVRKTNVNIEEVILRCDCKDASDLAKAGKGKEANDTASETGQKVCALLKRTLPSGGSSSGGKGSSSSAF